MGVEEDQKRIDDQSNENHAADQHGQKADITHHAGQTGCGNDFGNQPENTDRCKANDEANDVFNASSKIRHNAFSLVGSIAEGNAQADRPSQNTDVVRVGDCFDRIINDVKDQILHNFADAAGGRQCIFRVNERNLRRKQEARENSN